MEKSLKPVTVRSLMLVHTEPSCRHGFDTETLSHQHRLTVAPLTAAPPTVAPPSVAPPTVAPPHHSVEFPKVKRTNIRLAFVKRELCCSVWSL